MTPKKIYISERDRRNAEESDLIIAHKTSTIFKELGGKLAYNYEEVYILESEHNKQIEELKAENEKLKMQLHRYLDESSAKTWTSPHDATLTSINHNGKSYPIYTDLKEGHTYMTDIVDGKATIIDITQNL